MPRRYKNYRFALKTLVNPETGIASTPATGTALANFQEYISGQKKVSYERADGSKPGQLIKVAINPFALPLAATSLVKIPFSKRTNDNTNITTVKTACNHNDASSVLLTLNGFIPAKAVVFVAGGTAPATDPKSQITGVAYKPKAGNSYSLPYGQKTGKLTESEVRADILAAVEGLSSDATVSFDSEEY